MNSLAYKAPGGFVTVTAGDPTGTWSRIKSIANAMTNPRAPGGSVIYAAWAGVAVVVGGGIYWYYRRTKSTMNRGGR